MRVLFMGTPDFAVYSLEELAKHHEIIGVVSQPDKPKGRGKKLQPTPVKEFALEKGFEVYQPEKARDEDFVKLLEDLNPDCIAVTAYGQILPESILNIPKYGCINVHGSLLPKYRGAAPMQWSIINGDKVTGITTMYMAKGMDTGDMILKTEVAIEDEDIFADVHDKMAKAGAELLIETLGKLENGTATRTSQNEEDATYSPMIKKEDGLIDWSKSFDEINNLIRGLNPVPTAFTNYKDEVVKIFKGSKVDTNKGDVGEIVDVNKKGFTVRCGDGGFLVEELQVKGKKRMTTEAYLLGNKIDVGEVLK